MPKEIIINASKDRSRIAIVEQGELVELYVENPDNVRTIGNIYLGRIRKIMPAIRATFVDIGQQQDAFLHFSDLTDNVPELLTIAAGDIPDARSLMKAPKSVTASNEDDTATADLEVESDDERRSRHRREQTKRSRRGRRGGRRRGGRNRSNNAGRSDGGGRSEEEEEESRPRRTSPYVIDLTTPAAKSSPKPADKPSSRRRSSEQDTQTDAPAESKGSAADDRARADSSQDSAEAKPKRSSRSRSRRPKESQEGQESQQDAPTSDQTAPDQTAPDKTSVEAPSPETTSSTEADESKRSPRRRSQRRSQRTASGKKGETPQAEEGDEQGSDDTSEKTDDAPKAKRSSQRGRSSRSSQAKQDRPADSASEDDRSGARSPKAADSEADARGSAADPRDHDEQRDRPRRRSRRRGGRRRSGASDERQGDRPSNGQDEDSAAARDDRSERRSSRSRSSDRSKDQRGETQGKRDDRAESKESDSRDRRRDSQGRGRSGKSSGRGSSGKGSRTQKGGDSGEARPIAMVDSSKRAEDYLKRDQNILVKIIKEPISAKGSRISTDISLAGRFLVLVPMADYVAVSKKIESSKERRRLRSLASSLRPEGFGVIVRTVADGRDAKALDTDLSLLLDKWRGIEKQLRDKVKPPKALYEDVNMVSSIIRDLFSDDFDRILVDDPKLYRNLKGYIEAVAPQMAKAVQLYTGRQGIFRSAGIERSVEEAFSPRVNMKSGGYLIIEHTEAMHVVDVNSGRAGRGKSQSQNLLDVNLEAAKEIAKQLRLRDLGGIICVDFIDMRLDSHRKKLYDTLKQEFRKDRAVTKLLPMSDFGVVQITRQRLRPSITAEGDGEDGQEAAGAGEIVQSERARREIERIAREEDVRVVTEAGAAPTPERPSAAEAEAADEVGFAGSRTAAEAVGHLEAWLQHYRDNVGEKHKNRPIVVRVHPFMAAFLKRGIPSTLLRWRMRLRQPRFEVDVADDVNPLAFEVCDKKSGKDLTKKYTVSQ